jgi:starch phosphorylase
VRWVPAKVVMGVPYDTPILGYRVNTVNTLRLWSAEAPESFDFAGLQRGDYYGAVNQKVASENLSKVLYPNDEQLQGKELRLEQQYFFVSCSLQDMLRILRTCSSCRLNALPREVRVSSTTRTRPSRGGADAPAGGRARWPGTTPGTSRAHLRLHQPHAAAGGAGAWPLALFARVLPRHLEIIYEINARFLDEVRIRFPATRRRCAAVADRRGGPRYVRMAHLACVGSHAINGVAALHSELLKRTVLRDFHELWPEKFQNKTNGVTPRRWMVLANPRLATG